MLGKTRENDKVNLRVNNMKYYVLLVIFFGLYLAPAAAHYSEDRNQALKLNETNILWLRGHHGSKRNNLGKTAHINKSAQRNAINLGRGGWGSGGYYGAAGAYLQPYSINPAIPANPAPAIAVPAITPVAPTLTTLPAASIDPNAPANDFGRVFQKIKKEQEQDNNNQQEADKDGDETT